MVKLETSNFARIRTAVSSNENNAKLGQKGLCGGHVTQFRNFGNRLISHERFKLETSNLARRRMAVSSIQENEIRSKGVLWGSRDPILRFWEPPNISRTVEAKNFKFGTDTYGSEF